MLSNQEIEACVRAKYRGKPDKSKIEEEVKELIEMRDEKERQKLIIKTDGEGK